MWKYTDITREEFEARKDFTEAVLKELGATVFSCAVSDRAVFEYAGSFYRVDEILFPDKPFIVIECADKQEVVQNNIMEDADSFPFDLSDDEIREETERLLNDK